MVESILFGLEQRRLGQRERERESISGRERERESISGREKERERILFGLGQRPFDPAQMVSGRGPRTHPLPIR